NDNGRPDTTATWPTSRANCSRTDTALAVGRAVMGSATVGESVPSKSVRIAVARGARRTASTNRCTGSTLVTASPDQLWKSVPRTTITTSSSDVPSNGLDNASTMSADLSNNDA